MAQPRGGQVVAGSATLSTSGGSLTVTQTSGRAIINWQDFSLGAGEFARFIQPDAASATLNRVVSNLPSDLEGTLQANGQVYLINPNGVIIGSGARIDTGGFLASTLDVADAEFLAGGDLHFSGTSTAAIQNLGAINALGGDVFLIARQVENSGAISAANGAAGIAAGSEVLLTTGGDERLFIRAASMPGTVVNSGTIAAATAELRAAGGNSYALAIQNSGLVRATGSAVRNGQIWLVASGDSTVVDSGSVDASSATGQGGKIVVTGGKVLLDNGARLDASGATGGGEVDIGGGSKGGDASIPNASDVVMQAGAEIDVGATTSGDGGSAVLWSGDYTAFRGVISAQGGSAGGNGGSVETSSLGNLEAVGTVNAGAPQGSAGQWTLDPVDVSIAASGPSGSSYANVFVPTSDSVILASSIVSSLNGGSDVTITTGTTGSSNGDISVDTALSWTGSQTLTLSAHRNVEINADITATGATAGLVLTPNADGGSAGSYSLNNGASITLPGATPSLSIAGVAYTVINSVGVAGDASLNTLQGMRNALSGHYALGSDIDAMATSGWNGGLGFAPIGKSGFFFTGIFDGLGHTICDLTVDRPTTDYNGLFGYISGATIQNVGMTGSSITGHFYNAPLVGYNNGGTVTNSYATGGSVAGNEESAGLVAANYGGGTVSYSFATGSVNASNNGLAGGLVADNNGTVSNSWASGSVSGNNNVGGLVGTSAGTISNSYATGAVSGPSVDIGGLAGGNGGTISNSYATGTVNGANTAVGVGGLAGYNIGGISNSYATGAVTGNGSNIGGLVGENGNSNGTLATSYSTGLVTSTGTAVGGLMGGNNGTVTLGYWNSQVNGATPGIGTGTTTGAAGLTTAQMRTAASFTGFVFTTTPGAAGNNWVLVDADGTLNNSSGATGATYPMLTSEYSTFINGDHQLQLVQMAPTASYVLANDIAALSTGNATDVWGPKGFIPIGTDAAPFGGTFDGAGHNISNLTINLPTTNEVGLFGVVGGLVGSTEELGTVSNLGLIDPSITGHANVGGMIGTFAIGTVSGCYVEGGTVAGSAEVGGMVGFSDFQSGNDPLVTNSYTDGITVTGTTDVGGLVGYNGGAGSINNAYSASTVNGTTRVGELVGNNVGAISGSFWDETVKAKGIGSDATPGATPGAVGMTSAQMKQQLDFTSDTDANGNANPGWDFGATWVMYDGNTDPLLRAFMKPLTVTAADASKTYDGLAFSGGTSVTYTPCPDDSLILGTLGYGGTSQGAINVGSYAITPQGLYSNQQGYIITVVAGALTVNKANLVLSGTEVYNGTTAYAGANLTATGVNGETFSLTGAGAAGNLAGKNVQSNQALSSLTGLALGSGNTGAAISTNYNGLSLAGSSVSVTKANLVLTGTRVYDGTTLFAGSLLTAMGVDGESFSVTGAGATGDLSTKDVQTSQALASLSGLALGTSSNGGLTGNYNVLSAGNASVSVTPANLTLSGTRVYDGTTIFAGSNLTATGVDGETFTVTGAGAVGDLTTKNVQTSQLLASVAGLTLGTGYTGAALSTNYNILGVGNSSVSVTKANLVLLSGSRVYDGSTVLSPSALTATGVDGETFSMTGSSITLASKDVQTGTVLSSYAGLSLGTSSNGGLAGNYTPLNIAVTTSSVDVTAADLVLSGTRVYDGTTIFAGSNLTATGVDGETFTVTGAGATGDLGTKDVQTGQSLASVAGLALGVSGNGGLAGDYNALSTTKSSVSVTQANLTLGGTRVYDGTTIFAGSLLTATGVDGETFAVTGAGATGDLGTKNVQTSQLLASLTGLALGTSGNGGVSSNYSALSLTGSSVSVTPAPLTVTTSNVVKTYDGGTTAVGSPVITVGQLFGSDALTFSPFSPTYAFVGKDVGVGNKTVTVSGIGVNDGNGGGNYTLTLANNTTSTINTANLTLNGTQVYNGTTDFAGASLTATGVDGETFSVTGSGASGDLSTKNVQTSQLLASVAGLGLGTSGNGGLSTNYNALAVAGSSVSVTPANLTLAGSQVYNGTTAFAGLNLTATGVDGETFTVTGAGASGNLGTKDVQTSQALTSLSGLALGISSNGGLSGNYNALSLTGSSVSVTPANLTLTGTRVYDGTTIFAGSLLTAMGVDGETFTVTGAGSTGDLGTKNVQTNRALASFAGLVLGASGNGGVAGNYKPLNVAVTGSSVSVTAAALTLSGTQVYNGTTDFAGANLTATGVDGETFTVTGAGATGDLGTKDVQTNQTLASVAGLSLGTSGNSGLSTNYSALATAGSSVSVTPADLTLSGTRVYDGTTIFAGSLLTATGVDGESFAVTGAGATGDLSTKDVQTNQALASTSGLALGTSSNGGLTGNYNVLSATGSSVSVTPASVTVSTSDVVKTYDGGTSALGTPIVTVGQLFGSDALASGPSGPSFAFVGKDVGIGDKTVTVTGVTVNDGDGGNDYNLILASNTTSTINKASLTLAGTRAYDGTTIFAGSNLTATGVDGETFAVSGAGAIGDLGTKNVQTNQALASVGGLSLGSGNSGSALAGNYNVLTVTGSSVSVTKASLSLGGTRVYDGTTILAGSNLTATGVDGETFTVTGAGATGDLATKNVQTNQALASVAGLALGSGNTGAAVSTNYTALATAGSSVSVTPASLTLSGTRVYDGTTIFAGNDLTATGVDGETFSVAGAGASGNLSVKDVQTNQALASIAGLTLGSGNTGAAVSGNYNSLTVSGSSVSVTPAPLTIAADDKTRGVNLANPALTATFTGLVGGDTSVAVTGLILSTTAVTSSPVGSYPISGSGASALDYAITFVPGTLSVGQVPLTIAADDQSAVYGGALPVFTASYDGLVNGDTASDITGLQFSTTATIGSNVGTYSITPFGATAPNYYLVGYVPGTLTINPAALSITANDASRLYGGSNPEFGANYTGFVNGDTPSAVSGLTLTTTADSGSSVGTYPITASAATAANYVITYVPGTLSVGQAPLSVAADSLGKVYGADLPTFTATYTGLLNGDGPGVVTGLQFSTTATVGSDVGMYSITPFGGTSANYLLSYVPGTLTIDSADLTITADDASRSFGDANPVFTASYGGFVNGDTSAAVSGLTIASGATPASGVGTYAITPSGAAAANYTISYVDGTLTVSDTTVTVGVTPEPVVTVAQMPVVTSDFAVVDLDNRLVLVPLDSQGGIVQNANNTPASVDGNLTLILDDVADRSSPSITTMVAGTSSPAGFTLVGGANLGSFELVGPLAGDTVLGGSGGRLSAQDQNDPGLFRESKVSMGGFNVIYHEELGEARRQNRSNTALGSSYREFSDSDNPQVIVVRAKADRKPSNRVPGPNS